MAVFNVGGSQQTSATTFDVKEQNQRPLSQRRTPDTLEGKNASSSCSFRHCFTRIRDFFRALFRCLFCIKDKPSKPEKEENEPTKQPERSKQSIETSPEQPLQQTPGEQVPDYGSDVLISYLSSNESAGYLTRDLTQCPSVTEKPSADFTDISLPQSVSGDESQTPQVVQPKTELQALTEPKDPKKEAIAFLDKVTGCDWRKYTFEVVAPLIAAAKDFAKLHPKVQDKVLWNMNVLLPTECADHALKVYLSKECLGERFDAFEDQGISISREQSGVLGNMFEHGFGSTYVPSTVPDSFGKIYVPTKKPKPVTLPKAAPAPLTQPVKAEKSPQPQFLTLGAEAQAFLTRFQFEKTAFQLRVNVLQQPVVQETYATLQPVAREQLLAYIQSNAESMHQTYLGIHEFTKRAYNQ